MKFDEFAAKFKEFKEHWGHKKPSKRIALLVDGPNMIRSQFNVRLDDVERLLEKYGELKVAKVFLNQYASEKLIEAVSNIGFEPVVTTTDADVPMALAAFELIMNANIDVIALMTRDADLQHVLTKAKAHGKETILIAADEQLSASLKNTADRFILVGNAPAIQRPIPSSDIEIKD